MAETFFDTVVETLAQDISDFFFVQIGACDGIVSDPIHKFIMKYKNWKGLLAEPQKSEFERLKKNYEGRDFIFENVAVSAKRGMKNLYKPKRDLIDEQWKRGIATMAPEKTMMKNYIKNNWYEIEAVECAPLKDLICKNNIKKINLLQIDAEGFDYEIIKMVDFKKIKPDIIHFETINLTKEEQKKCNNLLKSKDYCIFNERPNAVAVLDKRFIKYILLKKLSSLKQGVRLSARL